MLDEFNRSDLHYAARDADLERIAKLIDAGENVSLADDKGWTPLFRAVFISRGQGDVIAILREAGADPSIPNGSGVSPVSLARTIGNYDVAVFFEDLPDLTD